MKNILIIFLIAIFFQNSNAGELKEGMAVKNFKIPADNGETIELARLKGKWVILYFYPKDNSPGCTREAKTFSKLKKDFEKLNAIVFGINKDNIKSHKKFKEKQNITITLLYDKTGEVSKYFGVKTFFSMCKRDTILINPEGKIEKIYRGVNPEGNPEEILNYLKKKEKGNERK